MIYKNSFKCVECGIKVGTDYKKPIKKCKICAKKRYRHIGAIKGQPRQRYNL